MKPMRGWICLMFLLMDCGGGSSGIAAPAQAPLQLQSGCVSSPISAPDGRLQAFPAKVSAVAPLHVQIIARVAGARELAFFPTAISWSARLDLPLRSFPTPTVSRMPVLLERSRTCPMHRRLAWHSLRKRAALMSVRSLPFINPLQNRRIVRRISEQNRFNSAGGIFRPFDNFRRGHKQRTLCQHRIVV